MLARVIHELVAKAAADCELAEQLESHLLSEQVSEEDRQLATALLISCAMDPGADMPSILLDVVIELARQEQPDAVRREITRQTATLLKLTRTAESDLQTAALQVLGHGLPDPALAQTLATIDDETAQLAAARLDPQRYHSLGSPVTALVAARELGLEPSAAHAAGLASALSANPDALYELEWRDTGLDSLLTYLGPHRVTALEAIAAPTAAVQLRREAACAIRRLYPADDLTVFIGQLLDDPDEVVRREALRTICPTPELAQPFADRIAQLLHDSPKNRRLATGALLQLEDPRWKATIAQVIRDGLLAKQFGRPLEDEADPSPDLRAAVAERLTQLLEPSPGPTPDVPPELSSLIRIARRWDLRSLVPVLAQALPSANPVRRLLLGNALARLGEGNPVAIEALGALKYDDVYFGYLAHQAGADPNLMRDILLATPTSSVEAAVYAADLFGDSFPGIIERFEYIQDHGPRLKDRVVGARALFHLTGRQPPADLLNEALTTLSGRDAEQAIRLAQETGHADQP